MSSPNSDDMSIEVAFEPFQDLCWSDTSETGFMREFFKPWRRKIGVVTLVMACVCTAGWIRSLRSEDSLTVRAGNHITHQFSSGENELRWDWVDDHEIEMLPNGRVADCLSFQTTPTGASSDWRSEPYADPIGRRHFQCLGIDIGPTGFGKVEIMTCRIPYWSITMPLALLSAWLLVSKPRLKLAAAPAAESSPEMVA